MRNGPKNQNRWGSRAPHPLLLSSPTSKKTFDPPPLQNQKHQSKTFRYRAITFQKYSCLYTQKTHLKTYSTPQSPIKSESRTEVPKLRPRQKKMKPPYLFGEDVCRVSREQAERVFAQTRIPKDLKCLFNFRQVNRSDVEVPKTLPGNKESADSCEIGIVYAADSGHDRGDKHVTEISATSGLHARWSNYRIKKNILQEGSPFLFTHPCIGL